MNFYALEERMAEAIDECRTRVRVRVSVTPVVSGE